MRLEENPEFVEVDCTSLKIEALCNNKAVNNWCKWNDNLLICENNYESILFISAWDIAALPKSVIALLVLIGCMALYWFCGLLTRKLKVFKNIESDKIDKCQIYIFELIGLTISLSYLLYEQTFNIIFKPGNYADIGPVDTINLVRSLASSVFLMNMYLIEMLTNNLRWSLQLHHVAVIVTAAFYMFLLDGSADLASLRWFVLYILFFSVYIPQKIVELMVRLTINIFYLHTYSILAVSLYPFTEHNVFAQLLLYRISPLYSWRLHFMSAILYTLTRIFGTVTFIYCYISWSMTDAIYDQFRGEDKMDVGYVIFFFLMPITTILLNIAQFQTIKALFYISNSTKQRIKERNELRKNPRLQELYDLFIDFDANDDGHWTMMDFKKFIFYHSTFIKHETCIIIWNVLGYSAAENAQLSGNAIASNAEINNLETDHDVTENRGHGKRSTLTQKDLQHFENNIDVKINKRQYMKWKDLKKIFGKHIINTKFKHYSVKQVISAQLQVLLQTIFNTQTLFEQNKFNIDEKDRAISQLYNDVNLLAIGDKNKKSKKRFSTKTEKMFETKECKDEEKDEINIVVPNIEMYIVKNDSTSPAPDHLQYAMSLDHDYFMNRQLEIDDAMRESSITHSNIAVNMQGLMLKDEKTI